MSISLKKADFSDIEFLWYLRNQPETYRYSYQSDKVNWEEHINWITPVILGLNNKELFIIKDKEIPVGQVRLDDKVKISISILKEFQGKGFASQALGLAIKDRQRLIADINKENTASIRLFEKLNFKLKEEKGEWFTYEKS